jgi:arylsulfatase A-like enzyme
MVVGKTGNRRLRNPKMSHVERRRPVWYAQRVRWVVTEMVLAMASLAVLSACSHRPADPARVDSRDVGVVLIVLDAAGAKHFGVYGNPLPVSPNVDALARDGGTVFERAYAQSAWTLPSTASLLTGRYPRRRTQPRTVVAGETLASSLRAAGFRTAAFSENPYVTAPFGFDQGFDEFHEYFPKSLLDERPRDYQADSARPATDAIAWLAAHPSDRTFLYLHLLTPHSPYVPPPPFRDRFAAPDARLDGSTDTLLRLNEGTLDASAPDIEQLRLRYLENLAYGDDQVGRVVDALRQAGRLDRTIVIVASDHGEAFREHGVVLHTTTLYEEMIHVPLVLRLPPRFGPMPARVAGIVELRDLVPTLCHALQTPCAVGTARSLIHDLRAAAPRPRVARAWTSDGEAIALGAIVTPDRKLVRDRTARRLALFDLARDAGELHDLAGVEVARARHLARRLHAPRPPLATTVARRDPLDDTGRKLRALGYVH